MSTKSLQKVQQVTNAIIPITALIAHPENPNEHPESQLQQLKASHDELGQFQSAVVWAQPDQTYIIVSGHGYIEGAKRAGATEIRADILPAETSPETIEAILIAANQHQKNSVTNDDLLASLFRKQQQVGRNLLALGADNTMVRQLYAVVEANHSTDFLTPFLASSPAPIFPRDAIISPIEPAEPFTDDGDGGAEMTPTVPVGSNGQVVQQTLSEQFFQFTVPVTQNQRSIVLDAISKAKEQWSLVTSQDALTAICQHFLG